MAFKIASEILLIAAVILALAIGITVNLTLSEDDKASQAAKDINQMIALPGRIWIRAMKLVVLPLIFSNILVAVYDIRQQTKSGRLMGFTILYCLVTTVLAGTIGLIYATVVLIPNVNELAHETTDSGRDEIGGWANQVQLIFDGFVPSNVVAAMADNNLIGIIFVAACVGILIKHTPDAPSILLGAARETNRIMFEAITVLIKFTPIAVFCLLYTALAIQKDLGSLFSNVGILVGCVVLGLSTQVFVVYPALYFVFNRSLPFRYYKNMLPAVLMAMGCASSAATLPVTLACVEKNGIRPTISKFVCSLGATMNMDGTAVNFPMSVIWLATAQGMTLSVGDCIVIVIIATLASVGTAPIPSAGLVLLINIMEQVNVPVTNLFAMIVAVDFINDRMRTMTNVLGDSICAANVDAKYGHLFTEIPDEFDTVEKGDANQIGEFPDAMMYADDIQQNPFPAPYYNGMPMATPMATPQFPPQFPSPYQ